MNKNDIEKAPVEYLAKKEDTLLLRICRTWSRNHKKRPESRPGRLTKLLSRLTEKGLV
jgi:hypothetical protein